MSACAFSISSSRSTQCGVLRMASVSRPPSSYPTYPAGEPISLATVCFSAYSLMSKRTSSMPISFARTRHTSVLPTPVGPTNSSDATGLSSSNSPALPICTASTICFTASSCPYICSVIRSCRVSRLASSSSFSIAGAILHIFASTSSMSAFVTATGASSLPVILASAFAPVSSMRSMALSGRKRSLMYLALASTA